MPSALPHAPERTQQLGCRAHMCHPVADFGGQLGQDVHIPVLGGLVCCGVRVIDGNDAHGDLQESPLSHFRAANAQEHPCEQPGIALLVHPGSAAGPPYLALLHGLDQ